MSVIRSIYLNLPGFVRRPLSNTKTYVRRIKTWRTVLAEIQGQGPGDQAALKRASRYAILDSFRDLRRWRNPMLLEDATVNVGGVGLFRVRARCDDLYHVLPSHEKAVFDTIRDSLKPGDVFVDAGANIGFYTVFAAKLVGPTGRVIAVEMMPDTLERLRDNVRLNELTNVTIVPNALSDVEGQTVRATVTDGIFGQASISEAVGQTKGGTRTVEVATTTLERILADVESVKLMKMDLEGVEIQALRGAGGAIGRIRAIIFEDWTGSTQSTDFWESRGFRAASLDQVNGIATLVAPKDA